MINRRARDGAVFWRCTRSRNSHCTGTVTTGPDDVILSTKDTHNHPPSDAEVTVKKIVSTLKEQTQASIRPVPQIYQEEIQKIAAAPNSEEVAARLPTLPAVKSSLYRRRRKLIPQLPATRADVHFEGEWALSVKGENFLLAEEGADDKIIIFATDDHLRKLAGADMIFIDGTFQTCPRLFYQIFSIHAILHGKHVPLVYCLLPNKRQETYERVFQLLEEKVRDDLQLELLPSTVLSDYELAIMNGARAAFPAAVIKGCYFHFCQALLRKVQDLGLQVEYQSNRELRSFVRRTAAVAFVPLRYVRLGWFGVKAVLPNVPRIDEFVDYFQRTWISGSYPPSTWNVHDLDDCRTNNHIEGWHSKLKKVLGN